MELLYNQLFFLCIIILHDLSFIPYMPDRCATHFNFKGEADSYGSCTGTLVGLCPS